MKKMKITEIQIVPITANDGHVGFCSFLINESFKINSVAIFSRLQGGYRLVYPNKIINNKPITLFYPINKETSEYIESEVSKYFENLMKKDDMHYGDRNSYE